MWVRVKVHFFPCRYPLIPAPLMENTIFPPTDCFGTYVENQIKIEWAILGLSTALHFSTLCQHHSWFCSFILRIQVRPYSLLTLLFFFENALDIPDSLRLHINVEYELLICSKMSAGITDQFGKNWNLNIESSNP